MGWNSWNKVACNIDEKLIRETADAMVKHFADAEAGGFYYTADDHEQLIARNKDVYDNATPSGTGGGPVSFHPSTLTWREGPGFTSTGHRPPGAERRVGCMRP